MTIRNREFEQHPQSRCVVDGIGRSPLIDIKRRLLSQSLKVRKNVCIKTYDGQISLRIPIKKDALSIL